MACTTILVGKKASYDGSTMIARNDDSGSGSFTPKKFVVIHPSEQPTHYKSEISHVEIELPDHPMRYTAMPNAVKGEGIWAASGVNAARVGMTATETITSNPRVLGADPLVMYQPAEDGKEEVAGGIGEEDIVYIVLPYIHSAREGVQRLGSLLEQYGTYEMNGIAFQDKDEIWWLETIGGHHWIARRVPDDVYVVMPNQLGLDQFDLEDALGEQKEYMCSADMREFIQQYHLDLSMDGKLNPRDAFGSHDDVVRPVFGKLWKICSGFKEDCVHVGQKLSGPGWGRAAGMIANARLTVTQMQCLQKAKTESDSMILLYCRFRYIISSICSGRLLLYNFKYIHRTCLLHRCLRAIHLVPDCLSVTTTDRTDMPLHIYHSRHISFY